MGIGAGMGLKGKNGLVHQEKMVCWICKFIPPGTHFAVF
jgi:hypothetical protein